MRAVVMMMMILLMGDSRILGPFLNSFNLPLHI